MNIFVLDLDPQKCAEYHMNRHCTKMIIEYAQLLSNAHWLTGSSAPYKATHKNHPCSKWVLQSQANYKWLVRLGLELCKEYTFRYGKVHATQEKLEWLAANVPDLPNITSTPFVQAMPDYCKVQHNAVAAYRNYYCKEKTHLADWKNRSKPEWYHAS